MGKSHEGWEGGDCRERCVWGGGQSCGSAFIFCEPDSSGFLNTDPDPALKILNKITGNFSRVETKKKIAQSLKTMEHLLNY